MPRAKTDLRAQLEAMAEGRNLAAIHGRDRIVDPAIIEKHGRDFSAWSRFAALEQEGEPLAAPAEILAPLP